MRKKLYFWTLFMLSALTVSDRHHPERTWCAETDKKWHPTSFSSGYPSNRQAPPLKVWHQIQRRRTRHLKKKKTDKQIDTAKRVQCSITNKAAFGLGAWVRGLNEPSVNTNHLCLLETQLEESRRGSVSGREQQSHLFCCIYTLHDQIALFTWTGTYNISCN